MNRDRIKGAMLCGAGGGGFLLLLLSQDVDRKNVESIFEKSILPMSEDFEAFSFHGCRISKSGLTSSIIDKKFVDADTYELSWQSSEQSECE